RWRGEFPVTELGRYVFTIEAWVDHFETWSRQLAKRLAAGQDVRLEPEVGARMIEETAARADGTTADSARLRELAKPLRIPNPHPAASPPTSPASGEANAELTTPRRRYADRAQRTTEARQHQVRAARRAGKPVGDRIRGGRPRGGEPSARHPRRLPPPGQDRRGRGHRRGARHRVSVLTRSPLHARASRVVQAPARRLDPVRGKPAEEVRGHLPVRLRDRALARALAGASVDRPL